MTDIEFFVPGTTPTSTPSADAPSDSPTNGPTLEVERCVGAADYPLPAGDNPTELLRRMLERGGDDGKLYERARVEMHNAIVTGRKIEKRARKAERQNRDQQRKRKKRRR